MAGKNKSMITSDDILGKEAIDPEGEFLGVVMKLHIDREHKTLTGITIDQGFMKPDLFVGLEHIKRFGLDAIFLNKIPFEKYKGIKVFTWDGILVGTVARVDHDGGTIRMIAIKDNQSDPEAPGLMRKATIHELSPRYIQEIGDSLILKKNTPSLWNKQEQKTAEDPSSRTPG